MNQIRFNKIHFISSLVLSNFPDLKVQRRDSMLKLDAPRNECESVRSIAP